MEPLSSNEKQQLSHWEAQPPPDDFASRTVASLRAPRTNRWALPALSVAAMLALILWLWPRSEPLRGSIEADSRQEANLGGRAIAVLEGGAALQWEVAPDHTAEIIQTQGDVFYRVEPGGSFVVKTDLGDVTVQGTCFRVEVTPMKDLLLGGAIGAALSALVTITVYEGSVEVKNTAGAVALTAGESAQLSPNQAPAKGANPPTKPKENAPALVATSLDAPANDITRDELLRRDAQMREQLASLQTRLQEMEKSGPHDDLRKKDWWFEPSKEDLLQMAKDCRLPWDEPPEMDSPQASADVAKELEATPDEIEAMKKAYETVTMAYEEQLQALYLEVLGTAAPEDMSANAMIQEMESKSNEKDIAMANYLITQERAGLKEPPKELASRPAIERALRLRVSIGDVYEETLAEIIGKDRSHELRGKGKGWPRRAMMMGGCGELNQSPRP